MNATAIREFITTTLPTLFREGTRGEAGYALPESSLALVAEIVAGLGARRVFEFGSGQSTQRFLDAGCEVTALEDSPEWLAATLTSLAPTQRSQLTALHVPLQTTWLAGAPMRGWQLPTAALDALRSADLILVDSPALPPFREHALTLALSEARSALIVVDDANIPTVARFCRRLAERNAVAHRFAAVDHGLFFCGPAERTPLDVSRPWMETLKAWRRFFHPRGGA